jgi:hypothetical protein
MPMIGARFYVYIESLQNQCDVFEDELAKEMENGRLYRLLVRLGSINERPEYFFSSYLSQDWFSLIMDIFDFSNN